MFKQSVISFLLLAGCATQPAGRSHEPSPPRGCARPLPSVSALPIRVGVEYVDTDHAFAEPRPRGQLSEANARAGREAELSAPIDGPGNLAAPRPAEPKREREREGRRAG